VSRSSPAVELSSPVREALDAGAPVVALESTLIAHGLPHPDGLAAARRLEDLVREGGATPATVAVIDGVARVGLEPSDLERIATEEVAKASVRDLPVLAAKGASGATTVASTAALAAVVGIRVFATGAIGGVHRGATTSFDESADLLALATTPVTVVTAGAKSILDVGATLERLETLDVPVVGYRTDRFPGFWRVDSGHPVDWRVDSVEEVVAIMTAQDRLARRCGLVVANPIPAADELDEDILDRALSDGLDLAARQGLRGKDVTPFLLAHIVEATGGASLRANLALVENNARLAAGIAVAWHAASPSPQRP
jgi:pseudouridylate synthase